MRKIPINGIRLSREMAWAGCRYPHERDPGTVPLHRFLAEQRINMTCCGIEHSKDAVQVSACIDLEHEQVLQGLGGEATRVSALSVYPHRSDIRVPVMVAGLLHQAGIPVYHLVSSHAVVSVLVASADEASVIALLEANFDLPDSHTPFRQEVDTDMTQFLRKYPETRASYVEERIKTYGINLLENLGMSGYRVDRDDPRDGKFHFISMLPGSTATRPDNIIRIIRDSGQGGNTRPVDFIAFHGPHFGDRYRILDTALDCLEKADLPLVLAGCTGASINLVLPRGQGRAAGEALSRGFEAA